MRLYYLNNHILLDLNEFGAIILKIFGFTTSIILGILAAWIISEISFNQFFINLFVPLLIAGFLTSFLIAKDAQPPNFLKNYSILQNKVVLGIISSCVFVFLKITSEFLINLSAFGQNFGIYLFGFIYF